MEIYIYNYSLTNIIGSFIVNWYWIFLPFLFFPLFKKTWLWWVREKYEKKQEYVFLKMIIPKAVEKPIGSMEHIVSNLWSLYSGREGIKKFKKKWIIGKRLEYFCIEILAEGGDIHFFLRVAKNHTDTVKAAFYAQYSEIDFIEVTEDYTKDMSWNVPNHKWNFYGLDEELINNDVYPIKTYTQFFEAKPENIKEEKRIDSMSTMIETLGCLKNNEKVWIQMKFTPMSHKDTNFFKKGKAHIDKLVNRKKDVKQHWLINILSWIVDIFTYNYKTMSSEKVQEIIPSEMKLTPREREIVHLAEKKLGKNIFRTNIRGIYFGEGDTFRPSRKSLIEQVFSGFTDTDQNGFNKSSKTKTKLYHFFVKRRVHIRKRRIFRRYILRETPLYPFRGGTFMLSTEEIATIFHPPIVTAHMPANILKTHNTKAPIPENLPFN